MTDYNEDFTQLAKDAGLPTTESEINAQFDALRANAGLAINNTSAFGPFWRFVNAVATTAAQWLVDFIITTVLPQAFVKTASGLFLELHAWAVNVTRKAATTAAGQLEFTRANTTGSFTIPAGTLVQSVPVDGKVYRLTTTADATFADGDATVFANVSAESAGAGYNLGAGYYTVLPVTINGVTVTNLTDWQTVSGTDAETDNDLRERVRNQYSAVNQWHTDAVYTAIIAGFPGVTTDNVFFVHDAPRGPGTADAYVMLETGNPSAQLLADIQAEITSGNHGHGDDLQVFAVPETTHNLTCDVWPVDNLTASAITALLSAVESRVRCAFRENSLHTVTKTRPFDLFSFSQLAQEIHSQVPNVRNLAFSLSHIESDLDLPRLGTLTVQQNA